LHGRTFLLLSLSRRGNRIIGVRFLSLGGGDNWVTSIGISSAALAGHETKEGVKGWRGGGVDCRFECDATYVISGAERA
jgi:hypothetical protein